MIPQHEMLAICTVNNLVWLFRLTGLFIYSKSYLARWLTQFLSSYLLNSVTWYKLSESGQRVSLHFHDILQCAIIICPAVNTHYSSVTQCSVPHYPTLQTKRAHPLLPQSSKSSSLWGQAYLKQQSWQFCCQAPRSAYPSVSLGGEEDKLSPLSPQHGRKKGREKERQEGGQTEMIFFCIISNWGG